MRNRTVPAGEKTFPSRINKGKSSRPWESIFNQAKHAATRGNRNYSWAITYEEFLKFLEQEACHYCSVEVVWPLPHGGRDIFGNWNTAHHLDRTDNSKGYSVENCVVACSNCNLTKSNTLSYEEMLVIGKMRREKRERSETACNVCTETPDECCSGAECRRT